MDRNFNELIASFSESAAGSRKLLDDLLSIISDGRCPEKEKMDHLNVSIEGLRQKYDTIYQYATQYIPEKEIPEFGSPVQAYVKAIEENRELQFKELSLKAANILETFISVQSMADLYSSALEPYQTQARDILSKLSEGTISEQEIVAQEIAGPSIFLKALECKEFNTEEKLNILDEVLAYYPNHIQMGIAGQQYYLEDSEDQDLDTVEEVEVLEDHAGSEEGESDYVKAINEYGGFLKKDEDIGFYSTDINLSENKKISPSIFSKEMQGGFEAAKRGIIKLTANRNCFSRSFLTDVMRMPIYVAENALIELSNKGYLRKYSLIPGGSFYCASPRLMKAMTYIEGCKSLGIGKKSMEDWGDMMEEPHLSNVAARVTLTEVLKDIQKRIKEQNKDVYKETNTILSDEFIIGINNEEEEFIWVIGVFWNNPEDCDDFLTIVQEHMNNSKDIPRMIFAGYNLEYAKANAKALIDVLDKDFDNTDLYLYSFNDHKYFTYEEGKKTKIKNIWPIMEEDPEYDSEGMLHLLQENASDMIS